MIIESKYEHGLCDDYPGVDIQYYGYDALTANVEDHWKQRIAEVLFRECTIDIPKDGLQDGVVIGFENSNSFNDYYYIVYIPNLKRVEFALCNCADFYKTIR